MRRSDSRYRDVNKFAVAAFVVIATVFGLLHPAQAQIIYTPVNITINEDTYNLDVNNDGVTDFTITSFYHGYLCVWTRYVNEAAASGNGVVGIPPAPLKLGQSIGPKQVFYGGTGDLVYSYNFCQRGGGHGGRWRSGKTAYLGLSFQINGQTHYGWAELTVEGFEAVLTGYAYEATPGKALTAGQTH